jgi:hypothetical protein
MKLLKEHGLGNWTKIANQLNGRTDAMVQRRWAALADDATIEGYKQVLSIRRKVSPSLHHPSLVATLLLISLHHHDDGGIDVAK